MEQLAEQHLGEGFTLAWNAQAFLEKQSAGGGSGIYLFGMIMLFLILAARYESGCFADASTATTFLGLIMLHVVLYLFNIGDRQMSRDALVEQRLDVRRCSALPGPVRHAIASATPIC